MNATVYNREGKKAGDVKLPEEVFGLPWNADLVHQVVVSQQGNQRQSIAHTKDRSEVRGGGRKPWRQKGTGRARHGSRRSPIWRTGGVTFGPRNEEIFERKINRKMKAKALNTILSAKMRDNEILFIDDLGLEEPKTQVAAKILDSLSKAGHERINFKRGRRVLIAVPEKNDAVLKSFQNLGGADVLEVRNLSPLAAINYKYVLFANPEASVAVLSERNPIKKVAKNKTAEKKAPVAKKDTEKKTAGKTSKTAVKRGVDKK